MRPEAAREKSWDNKIHQDGGHVDRKMINSWQMGLVKLKFFYSKKNNPVKEKKRFKVLNIEFSKEKNTNEQ